MESAVNPDDAFRDLIGRLKSGDGAAAGEVFELYSRQLIGLARRRLTNAIGSKEDPEDVVQSVFRTFFRRNDRQEISAESWGGLWKLLTVITLRKCGHRIDYFFADRRSIRRESPSLSDEESGQWQAIARDPTPLEAAMLSETVEQLLEAFDERDRSIIARALHGDDASAIADSVGRSTRTVERVLARVRKKLENQQNPGDA